MKINYFRYFLPTLVVSILFITSVLGQNFAQIETEGTPGISSSSYYESTITVKVRVANLEKITTPDMNGVFSLPEHYSVLQLQYQVGDDDLNGSFTVADFVYDGDFTNTFNNGINYYAATFTIGQLDFTAQCTAEKDGTVEVPYSITFETASENVYPICDHTSVDDIFACDAFTITAPHCGNEKTLSYSCEHTDLNTVSGTVDFDCNAYSDQSAAYQTEIQTDESGLEALQILPNPFDQEIRLQGQAINQITSMSLFDAMGNLVQVRFSPEGVNDRWGMSTAQLPVGVYYLQVKSRNANQTFKLIKQ